MFKLVFWGLKHLKGIKIKRITQYGIHLQVDNEDSLWSFKGLGLYIRQVLPSGLSSSEYVIAKRLSDGRLEQWIPEKYVTNLPTDNYKNTSSSLHDEIRNAEFIAKETAAMKEMIRIYKERKKTYSSTWPSLNEDDDDIKTIKPIDFKDYTSSWPSKDQIAFDQLSKEQMEEFKKLALKYRTKTSS